MRVELLGPLAVRADEQLIDLRGSRLRVLCSRLALRAGKPVPTHELVAALWSDDPPRDATGALQSLVSRLRSALGDPTLVQQSGNGYLLAVSPDDVDALCFARLARDPGTVREALALWRGPVDTDLDLPGLDRQRLAATLDRIDLDLAVGATGLVEELRALAHEHPQDERVAGRLITALADAGRQPEALAAYEVVRTRIADDLGVDPSAGLRARHLAALQAVDGERPHNLRATLTSFVGREDELDELAARVAAHRLVTVVGAGGAGKTRLATEAAGRVRAPHGTWFVELAPVTDPEDVPRAVLMTVGLREGGILDRRIPPREVLAQLVSALGGRRSLLVLDNAEHLLDATAELTDLLLARCPELRVLTTSREPLGIAGESLVPVTPLSVPAVGANPADARKSASVILFADRAAAVRPGFEVDDGTVADVIEVVRRLDGLPLALELAAARLRTMPLADVRRRLDDRFRLLTGGSRTALPRHRTLHAVVAWSWDLLSEDERALAERASVFPGGLTADSATAVLQREDVDDLLAALTDKSLLQLTATGPAGGRYRMLETLREFGADRLAERGELEKARTDHARWFAALAKTADRHLRGADQLDWLERLEVEHENVIAGLRHLVETGDADAAVSLTLDLGWYWVMLGRHAQAAYACDLVLGLPPGSDHTEWLAARAVHALNALAAHQQDSMLGKDGRPELSDLAEDLVRTPMTRPLLRLFVPVLLYMAGRRADAWRLFGEVATSDDRWLRAAAQVFRGRFGENEGDLGPARHELDGAIATFRELGDRWGLATALPLRAALETYGGDLDAALGSLEEAADLASEFGTGGFDDRLFIALRLAELHLRRGDADRAEQQIALVEQISGNGSRELAAAGYAMLTGFRISQGDLAAARRLHATAEGFGGPATQVRPESPHAATVVSAIGALLCVAEGNLAGARERLVAAAAGARLADDGPITGVVAVAAAAFWLAAGDPTHAAHLTGMGASLRGAEDPTALDVRQVTDAGIAALGPYAWQAAWALGRAADRDTAYAAIDPDSDCPL